MIYFTHYHLTTDNAHCNFGSYVMLELDEDDLAVLALLVTRPLYQPPPLVRGIIEELQPSGLTVFVDDCWHATPLGREMLARNARDRSE